jgi:hypothetical protein
MFKLISLNSRRVFSFETNQRRRSKGSEHRSSNLSFLPNLNSLYLFKGQPVPRSIINPGGRRAGMAGNPLSDLDGAARISCVRSRPSHGNCDNKLVSGSRWPSPVSRPASRHSGDPDVSIQSFHDSSRRKEKVEHLDLMLGASVQAKDRPPL